MTQPKLVGNGLGQAHAGIHRTVRILAAAALVMAASSLFARAAMAQAAAGYFRIVTAHGALEGSSKDPAHMNWIPVASVVAGDLNGDAMADRESSAPSVSEITATRGAVSSRDAASGMASSKTASSKTGQGQLGSNSTSGTVDRAAAPRDSASGMAAGKRMHKPLVITKEIDKSSPLLSEACASGQHLKEVDIDLTSKPGHYKLTDVVISSDQKSGGAREKAMETITFNYQKIEWTR